MNPALHPEQRRNYLTAKTRELIAACGGIEAAAEICNRTKSTVGRWQDMDTPDSAPVECLMLMEQAVGKPIVSQALVSGLAPRAGARTGAPAPARAREDCAHMLAEMNIKAGTVVAELVLALADGDVSRLEAEMMTELLGKLRATIDKVENNLHAAVKPTGPRLVEG